MGHGCDFWFARDELRGEVRLAWTGTVSRPIPVPNVFSLSSNMPRINLAPELPLAWVVTDRCLADQILRCLPIRFGVVEAKQATSYPTFLSRWCRSGPWSEPAHRENRKGSIGASADKRHFRNEVPCSKQSNTTHHRWQGVIVLSFSIFHCPKNRLATGNCDFAHIWPSHCGAIVLRPLAWPIDRAVAAGR
jgi:hypothetical protein